MRIAFISNYLSPHQLPFCLALDSCENVEFTFVATKPISNARKELGYRDNDGEFSFVRKVYENVNLYEKCNEIISQADVVIFGSAPYSLVRERIKANKLVVRYAERPLKKGLELWKYPYRLIKWHLQNPANVYMLCASAYTASDYAKFGVLRNRCYKWGYFPETKQYEDIHALIAKKKKNSLVWVARYLDWKHPELAVEIGRRLKADGYDATLDMIGIGPLLDQITAAVKAEGLEDVIHIRGAMPPEEVRRYMEAAQIHIFTSDRQEGWGAVLNEAMNSACVPVVNRDVGSAPFLIENGVNGYLYSDADELYEKICYLLEHGQEREKMACEAYCTITEEWNAENAAKKAVELFEKILAGEKSPNLWDHGVCSKS